MVQITRIAGKVALLLVVSLVTASGLLAQLIINRAMGTPITRPKSVSTEWIKQQVGKTAAG